MFALIRGSIKLPLLCLCSISSHLLPFIGCGRSFTSLEGSLAAFVVFRKMFTRPLMWLFQEMQDPADIASREVCLPGIGQ